MSKKTRSLLDLRQWQPWPRRWNPTSNIWHQKRIVSRTIYWSDRTKWAMRVCHCRRILRTPVFNVQLGHSTWIYTINHVINVHRTLVIRLSFAGFEQLWTRTKVCFYIIAVSIALRRDGVLPGRIENEGLALLVNYHIRVMDDWWY